MATEVPVALVTGANRGIGLEVCRQLAAKGYRTLLGARTMEKARAAAGSVTGQVFPLLLDVTKPKTIAAALARVLSEFGRVDVLVNNAGILLDEGESILDVSPDVIQETFATNLLGAVAVSQAFVPSMVERKFGRVVNVSSRAGQLSAMATYAPVYSMSKTALNAFTRQLAAHTKGSGVLVNCVCPGWVRTDMGGRSAPRSVEEGADTIVWLATLPKSGPTGKFFGERQELEW